MDQAEGLRTIMNERASEAGLSHPLLNEEKKGRMTHAPRVISVTSGKGGVGKTNVTVNLGLALTKMGKRVLILDADLGLANIDILLGLTPHYTVENLFSGERSFLEIIVEGPEGLKILPASSGVPNLVDLNESQKLLLLEEVDTLAGEIDVLLIDTGAGISSNVQYFNTAAQESVVIVTPEPTSLTDAYALIKVLSTRHRKKEFSILVNLASGKEEALGVFRKLSRAADHFLSSLSLDYLGFIPYDNKLPQAVIRQKAVLDVFPEAVSSKHFTDLAVALLSRPPKADTGVIQFFWSSLIQSRNNLL